MTALAINAANRSLSYLGLFVEALDKAFEMARAVHSDTVTAEDLKKVRAIADTL